MAFPSAMVAIVAVAASEMGRKQVKSVPQGVIGACACLAILAQGALFPRAWWVTFAIVVVAGFAGWLLYRGGSRKPAAVASTPPQPSAGKALSVAPIGLVALFPAAGAGLVWKIFFTFAVMSVSLFGSGYVFIPIIKSSLVNGLHWLTAQEFTAGLALTQITPGPILMTAAFVGVKIAGLPGALAGMLGMFVPPAILTLIAAHSLQAIKKSAIVTAALKGVRPAVVGMLLAAAVVVGESMPHDTTFQLLASSAILAAALFALIRLRVEVSFIIPLSGIAGFFLFR
jgi:chromate transporter